MENWEKRMFHEPWEQNNGVYSVLPKVPLGVAPFTIEKGGNRWDSTALTPIRVAAFTWVISLHFSMGFNLSKAFCDKTVFALGNL